MVSERHHPDQARLIWPPLPGFFRLRLVKGAWAVPARIIHWDDDTWQAEIDGDPLISDRNPAIAEGVERIWTGGHRIPQSEYNRLLALKVWAAETDPRHPCLHPRRSIEPMLLTPLTPQKG